MHPGLKHLGLCLAATPWATGALLSFQKPVAFDSMTSRQGPRGGMRRTAEWERTHRPQQSDPQSFDYAAEDAVLREWAG
jgi:hypothetical protein